MHISRVYSDIERKWMPQDLTDDELQWVTVGYNELIKKVPR